VAGLKHYQLVDARGIRNVPTANAIARAYVEHGVAGLRNRAHDEPVHCVQVRFALRCQSIKDNGYAIIRRYRVVEKFD
jgi:hypothetical protein